MANEKYALLDTDFISKMHLIRKDDHNKLIDKIMAMPGYCFYCHKQIQVEIMRHNIAGAPEWFQSKIESKSICMYDDEMILDELSGVYGEWAISAYAGMLKTACDITALVLIFPPRDENEKYVLLPYFWIPEETIPRRVKANSVPYDIWEKQGYIMSTEGNVIHYDFIEKFIMYLSEKYHILEIAVDRWNATQMIQNLEGEGFTIIPFGQGFSSMSAPTKEFYRLLMEGRIIHGGNPVLRWMAGNVVIDTDPAGNIKVTKAKSKEKIDGIVAAIMALDRCIRQEGQSGSVYDERGLLVF